MHSRPRTAHKNALRNTAAAFITALLGAALPQPASAQQTPAIPEACKDLQTYGQMTLCFNDIGGLLADAFDKVDAAGEELGLNANAALMNDIAGATEAVQNSPACAGRVVFFRLGGALEKLPVTAHDEIALMLEDDANCVDAQSAATRARAPSLAPALDHVGGVTAMIRALSHQYSPAP